MSRGITDVTDAGVSGASDHPFDRVTEAQLRRRKSVKWTAYPPEVLPAWVAEMDFPLAEPIRRVLHAAIDADDVGYASPGGFGEAFAAWAQARWGWRVYARDAHLVADVVSGIAAILRVATAAGDGVVIDTPVYHPFAATIRELGRTVMATPLARSPTGWSLDLDAVRRAYERHGARAHILCSPHNPTGIVYPRATLAELASLAARHGVTVLSDEIHAPLVGPGATHTPFPMVSEAAAKTSVVVTSASKAWNLAGLKAALMVACSDEARALLRKLPSDTPFHAGHLGVLAGRAAFLEGEPWLADANAILERNRRLLGELLARSLPEVGYVAPEASYLVWLDCSRAGMGDDPARRILERGRLAVYSGEVFGTEGRGFVRMNIAMPRSLLEDAVVRMVRAARG
jgi:cystathionine beta-lyase